MAVCNCVPAYNDNKKTYIYTSSVSIENGKPTSSNLLAKAERVMMFTMLWPFRQTYSGSIDIFRMTVALFRSEIWCFLCSWSILKFRKKWEKWANSTRSIFQAWFFGKMQVNSTIIQSLKETTEGFVGSALKTLNDQERKVFVKLSLWIWFRIKAIVK